MATFVPLGPGTLELGPVDGETDFSCEVLSGSITHEYEEVGETRTMLCGDKREASRTRSDGCEFQLENDLTNTGLYFYLYGLGENPAPLRFNYIPNNDAGAAWSGNILPLLPDSIGADEYNAPITSTVTWPATELLAFTPATVPVP